MPVVRRCVVLPVMRKIAVALMLALLARPALARQDVNIGIGFGLAFLPTYICQELKLVEKQARIADLDVNANYQRFFGSGPMQNAIAAGAIDMGPYGVVPLLTAWERAGGTPQQVFAISGMTTLPLVLLTNRPGIGSIKDLRASDRIAMPSLSAPQMYLLEMESEKIWGRYDKLRGQVVVLPPAETLNAMLSGSGDVAAYFASAPAAETALASPKIHAILTSSEVMGRASFLIMGATRRYIEAHPKMPDVIAKAMQEAADVIRSDPKKAAEIYLKYEPSRTLDVTSLAATLGELGDDFGAPVHGIQAYADFAAKLGQLKNPPKSWKEIVTPSLANTSSS